VLSLHRLFCEKQGASQGRFSGSVWRLRFHGYNYTVQTNFSNVIYVNRGKPLQCGLSANRKKVDEVNRKVIDFVNGQ